jgi:hypothetical protein
MAPQLFDWYAFMFLRLLSGCLMLGILAWSPSAHAVTVDLKNLPNTSGAPTLAIDGTGITVSGSGNVNVWTPNGGLGIFGPEFNSGVDKDEFIVFSFESPVLGVSYTAAGSLGSAWSVEILGIDGVWSQDGGSDNFPVSALLDSNLPILGFKLTGLAGAFTIESLTYDLSPVPLPAALPLFGTGLLLMGLLSRRRWGRRVASAPARSR